jgi:hypothetical protein
VTFPAGAICHPGLGQELDTWTSQTPSLLLRWPLVLPSVLDRSGTFQGLVWCLPIGFCHRRWDVEVEGEDSSDPLWTGQGLKQCKAHGTCDFPQPRQRPPLKAQEKVWDAERPTKLLVTRQLRLLGPRSQHCQSPHSFSFLHGGPSGKHKSHLCSQQPLERCLKSESSAASPHLSVFQMPFAHCLTLPNTHRHVDTRMRVHREWRFYSNGAPRASGTHSSAVN